MDWSHLWNVLYYFIAFGTLGFVIGVIVERRRNRRD